MDGGVSIQIIKIKFPRDGFKGFPSHIFRNIYDFIGFINLGTGGSQKLTGFRELDFDPRILHQFKGFGDDLGYEFGG
jgi:hypothetical protein